MYREIFNRRDRLKFRRFGNKGYSLFACLGKEVIVGTLSVVTLSHAKANSICIEADKADSTQQTASRTVLLEGVDVTASRAPLSESRAARMVTVLDRKDIAAAPVQSINDLLKYAVGVDIRQRGPIGVQTDVSIRGGNYEQVTILLNGINVCDPQTGHNAFDLPVDISDIERIEVLEGPAGRVYGTSSLLGAINIVTKKEIRNNISARTEGGSYGYATAGVRTNIATKQWTNSVSGRYTRSDGYSRSKAGNLNADYNGGKFFYQGHYEDNVARVEWQGGLSAKGFGSNTFYGVKWDNQFEHTLKTFTAIKAETKNGKVRLRPSIYWNRNMDRFELFRGTEDQVPYNYHRTDVYGVNLNAYFDWFAGRTALGAEMRNEDLISTNLGEPLEHPVGINGTDREYKYGLDRTNISFVLEHNLMLNRFTLSAGLIAVKNSWNRMNMRIYPGIDASYRIGTGIRIYASYNTSLRMPSATELYYSVGGHKADKYLKPEELSAIECGVKFVSETVNAKVSVYYNHCKNMIDWVRNTDEGEDAIWESVNFTRINSLGMEISGLINLQTLLPYQRFLQKLDFAYSYIDQNKDEQAGLQSMSTLEYLRHKVVASLETRIVKKLGLGLRYRFQDRTGTYADVDGKVQDYRPYGIVDARLAWTDTKYKLYVEANNILDKRYVDFGNVPQPGAWIICGAAMNINL